jgi:membrane associated rhomboid family serine protease
MDSNFKYTPKVVALPLFFVLSLWVVYWLQIRFDFDFYTHGIYPRRVSGLQGVFLSPFIHADFKHLANNSLPLLILLAAIAFFYNKVATKLLAFGIIFSGVLTWFIGRSNYHIGASGLVYVLFAFIFLKGLLSRHYRLVALSFAVILVYGGMIWYVFPEIDNSISWEGHLSGLAVGVFFALVFDTPEYQKTYKYDWEHPDYDASNDRFMQRFDENGNFVNLPPPVEIDENQSYFQSSHGVKYEIKNSSDDFLNHE